jgi:hypothetical protein
MFSNVVDRDAAVCAACIAAARLCSMTDPHLVS